MYAYGYAFVPSPLGTLPESHADASVTFDSHQKSFEN